MRFDDGLEGVVDVAKLVRFTGVFEPLRGETFFAQVNVHPELGTACWPDDADLDSEVLYSKVSGTLIPNSSLRSDNRRASHESARDGR